LYLFCPGGSIGIVDVNRRVGDKALGEVAAGCLAKLRRCYVDGGYCCLPVDMCAGGPADHGNLGYHAVFMENEFNIFVIGCYSDSVRREADKACYQQIVSSYFPEAEVAGGVC